ncbi:Uncharacterised protein [Vibrio cholerae]|nr:Uncharacterised protein [Vibrio cholerae]
MATMASTSFSTSPVDARLGTAVSMALNRLIAAAGKST